MDAGFDTPLYNCIFCNTQVEYDDDSEDDCICDQDDCKKQMKHLVADYMQTYEDYKVKVAEINTSWATTMMKHFETVFNPHFMGCNDMYGNFNNLKNMFSQLEYMEENMPNVPTVTKAEHDIEITQLQMTLADVRKANTQLSDNCAQMSQQIAMLSSNSSANQAEFNMMRAHIEQLKQEKALVFDEVRARERELVHSAGEHQKIMHDARQAFDTSVARAYQLADNLEREKDKLSLEKTKVLSLEEQITRMEAELKKEKESHKLVHVTSIATPAPAPAPTQRDSSSTKVLASITYKPCSPITVSPGNGGYYHGPVGRVIYNW
jgi:hypothetical protein